MTDFLVSSQAATLANDTATDYLAPVREQGRALWQSFSLPTRKTEDWKYTSVASLKKRSFYANSAPQNVAVNLSLLTGLAELDAYCMVMVNGQFRAELSQIESANQDKALELCLFSQANEKQKKTIADELNSCFDQSKHGFAALNNQLLSDGVFIRIAKNSKAEKPLHIINISTEADSDFAINSRVLVIAEQGAEACVIEQFVSDDAKQTSLTNALSEFVVGENANLRHYRLQDEQESALHIGAVHSRMQRCARLNSFYLTLGSVLKRLDVSVSYEGEQAEATLNGVYLPQNKQHVDLHTTIEHAVPHCLSNEVFRGIIADEARAVFNGRIHIHRDAQKTEAFLSNKNLLTSNKAEIDTKPELEIYADDVRCAHGATVAQLDEKSMHYLRTRGISADEAKVLLSFGFINELLEEIADEQLLTWARGKLTQLFLGNEALTRHLA